MGLECEYSTARGAVVSGPRRGSIAYMPVFQKKIENPKEKNYLTKNK